MTPRNPRAQSAGSAAVSAADGHGPDDPLNLIVEVTGEKKKDKAAKVSAPRALRVPAINNYAGFGRWAFTEVDDPWDAAKDMRSFFPEELRREEQL